MIPMNCSNCGNTLKHITHQTEQGRFVCPFCGQLFLDYRLGDPIEDMDKDSFVQHFRRVTKPQVINLQRLFPHDTPKRRAMSSFAAQLLQAHLLQSLVKERYPTS